MPNPRPSAEQAVAFGARLRQLRQDRHFSLEHVALESDISLQHLSLLERGLSDQAKQTPANPRLGALLRLAQTLETDIAELIAPLSGSILEHAEQQVDDAEQQAGEEPHPTRRADRG